MLFIVLALLDVEANYLIVLAYRYTSILSVTLLDAWAIPCVLLVGSLAGRRVAVLAEHYHSAWRWRVVGLVLALGGLAVFIAEDLRTGRLTDDNGAPNSGGWRSILSGDLLVLLGASMYAASNVLQEYLVKTLCNAGVTNADNYYCGKLIDMRQYRMLLGKLGAWGTLISALQVSLVESSSLWQYERWGWSVWALLMLFAGSMFLLYSLTPVYLHYGTAAALNISLLTSDFYVAVWSLLFLGFQFTPLYAVGFGAVIVGLLLYNCQPSSSSSSSSAAAVE
jgi:solute carrier family 35 protein F1/2